MATQGGPDSIVTDGLVFYMDAGNAKSFISGSTTVYDMIHYTVGTIINSSTDATNIYSTEGKGSWLFDGTDERIDCDTFTNIVGAGNLQNYSIECWIKADGIPVAYDMGWGSKTTSFNADPGGYGIEWHGGVGWYADGSWGSSRISPYTGNLNYTNWHNVVVTYDGSNVNLYEDGINESTAATTGDMYAAAEQLCIGGTGAPAGTDWDGWVTAFRIYNRAITDAEVLHNYNAQKSRFGL